MTTIAQLVKEMLNERPFVQECLNESLINFGALARQLKPGIEKKLNKKVKTLAISMAIRRYNDERKKKFNNHFKFYSNIDITAKSSLVEFILKKSTNVFQVIHTFSKNLKIEEGDFVSVTQGSIYVSVLTNQRHKKSLKSLLRDENIIFYQENIGAVFLTFPPKIRDIPGIYYLVTQALASNNISALSLLTIYGEIVTIYEDADVAKAYQVLYDLINKK